MNNIQKQDYMQNCILKKLCPVQAAWKQIQLQQNAHKIVYNPTNLIIIILYLSPIYHSSIGHLFGKKRCTNTQNSKFLFIFSMSYFLTTPRIEVN